MGQWGFEGILIILFFPADRYESSVASKYRRPVTILESMNGFLFLSLSLLSPRRH